MRGAELETIGKSIRLLQIELHRVDWFDRSACSCARQLGKMEDKAGEMKDKMKGKTGEMGK